MNMKYEQQYREKKQENKPEKRFKAGPITATVWMNHGTKPDGSETIFRTVSFDRSYKDKDEKWHHTNTMRIVDIPKAKLVLSKAYEYLTMNDSPVVSEENIA